MTDAEGWLSGPWTKFAFSGCVNYLKVKQWEKVELRKTTDNKGKTTENNKKQQRKLTETTEKTPGNNRLQQNITEKSWKTTENCQVKQRKILHRMNWAIKKCEQRALLPTSMITMSGSAFCRSSSIHFKQFCRQYIRDVIVWSVSIW